MVRIFLVARNEFLSIIRSRAFLLMAFLLPAIGLGTFFITRGLSRIDSGPNRFAVVDESGALADALVRAAAQTDDDEPSFIPVPIAPKPDRDAQRLELSRALEAKEFSAVVELPAALLATDPTAASEARVSYRSLTPSANRLRMWLQRNITRAVREQRGLRAGLPKETVALLERSVTIESKGPLERGADGALLERPVQNPVATTVIPLVAFYLVFLLTSVGAPLLLQAVIEEKSSRVSEILLGLVEPVELMAGKLVGAVAAVQVIALVYAGAALLLVARVGLFALVPWKLIVAFPICLSAALLLYGALYLAIGSACETPREAQSLMMPVVILLVLPATALMSVLENPQGLVATAGTFVPWWAPFLVMLRLAITPGPPWWQLALSAVTVAAAIFATLWVSGRIFRAGLLWRGKAPSFRELLRLVREP